MKIQLVEVTNHDSGWKGTWYKTGERHFVRQDPDWPKLMACKWRALDVSGGIHEADCRVEMGITREQYEAAIPKCCAYQTMEAHESIMLCCLPSQWRKAEI
jgi:hypothetical protein